MPRAKRQALNQAVFREVNDRIAELSAGFAFEEGESLELFCECYRTGCREMLRVQPSAYARIRLDPALFLLVQGHADPSHETVVEEFGKTVVARVLPEAARGGDN